MTGDESLNTSGSSHSFPLVSHPAFGLYTSRSGRSEFGGLGSLGLSALAAHSQFGAFPGKEAHSAMFLILMRVMKKVCFMLKLTLFDGQK